MAKAPGIKRPRVLMDVPLRDSALKDARSHMAKSLPFDQADAFLRGARTDPLLMPPVKLAPLPHKRRQGLRLAIRRLCYFVLSRT